MAAVNAARAADSGMQAIGREPIFNREVLRASSAGVNLINGFDSYARAVDSFSQAANNYAWNPTPEGYSDVAAKFGEMMATAGAVIMGVGRFVGNPAMIVIGFGLLAGGTYLAGEYGGFGGFLDYLGDLFFGTKSVTSPIVLDLDGDGVETTSVLPGTPFDYAQDGFAERTGWAAPDDGLLVLDRDNDGQIESGREMFGNETLLASGATAQNGFQALAELDSNRDGVISAADTQYAQLRVWRDLDSDGVTDAGELTTLANAGVVSIDTQYTPSTEVDEHGNEHRQIGRYTRTDGSIREATDVWFVRDPRATVPPSNLAVSEVIARLPQLEGSGTVYSLHQAMARDSTGQLQTLVQSFVDSTDPAQRAQLVDSIIFQWTGAAAHSPSSRGSYIADARKLYALEALLGDDFVQGAGTNAGTANPGPNAAGELVAIYAQLHTKVYGLLLAQGTYADLFSAIDYTIDETTGAGSLDIGAAVAQMRTSYLADPTGWMATWSEFSIALQAMDTPSRDLAAAFRGAGQQYADTFGHALQGGGLNYIGGTSAAETLAGTGERDSIFGDAGNDLLRAGAGEDVLDGGAGNDTLEGQTGSDTYLFGRTSGNDLIQESYDVTAHTDAILLDADVTAGDVTVRRDGTTNDLLLRVAGTSNVLRVDEYFFNSGNNPSVIEQIRFADGTHWGVEYVKALALQGTSGNDVLVGYAGADVMDGGAGNDTLDGRGGSDTYRFGRNSGNDVISESYDTSTHTDVIEFAPDVAASDVVIARDGTNLILTIAGSANTLKIQQYFYASGSLRPYAVEQMRFADGTTWTVSDVISRVPQATQSTSPATMHRSTDSGEFSLVRSAQRLIDAMNHFHTVESVNSQQHSRMQQELGAESLGVHWTSEQLRSSELTRSVLSSRVP